MSVLHRVFLLRKKNWKFNKIKKYRGRNAKKYLKILALKKRKLALARRIRNPNYRATLMSSNLKLVLSKQIKTRPKKLISRTKRFKRSLYVSKYHLTSRKLKFIVRRTNIDQRPKKRWKPLLKMKKWNKMKNREKVMHLCKVKILLRKKGIYWMAGDITKKRGLWEVKSKVQSPAFLDIGGIRYDEGTPRIPDSISSPVIDVAIKAITVETPWISGENWAIMPAETRKTFFRQYGINTRRIVQQHAPRREFHGNGSKAQIIATPQSIETKQEKILPAAEKFFNSGINVKKNLAKPVSWIAPKIWATMSPEERRAHHQQKKIWAEEKAAQNAAKKELHGNAPVTQQATTIVKPIKKKQEKIVLTPEKAYSPGIKVVPEIWASMSPEERRAYHKERKAWGVRYGTTWRISSYAPPYTEMLPPVLSAEGERARQMIVEALKPMPAMQLKEEKPWSSWIDPEVWKTMSTEEKFAHKREIYERLKKRPSFPRVEDFYNAI